MKKKLMVLNVLLVMVMLFSFIQPVFAFSDVAGHRAEKEMLFLKERGIFNGYNDGTVAPNKKLTVAAAVSVIVKAFDLNIDHIRFIKEPKASDNYTKVKDDKWYSTAFIHAFHNGVVLPKDVNPNEPITKELFADLIFKAMTSKKEMFFIEIFMMINDEEDISPEFMNSIQKILIANIDKLDENKNFYPQKKLSRSEGAVLLYNAIQFFEEFPQEHDNSDVTYEVLPVTEDVNQVIVRWGEKTFGHSLKISKIHFEAEEAIIYYELSYPIPGEIYPQVMVEPKDTVYLASQYTPILKMVESEEVIIDIVR